LSRYIRMENASGRTRIYFRKSGKVYNRYIHTDKNGKKYINFQDKKIDLHKLKHIVQIVSDVTSLTQQMQSSPNYRQKITVIEQRRVIQKF
jgi:hypothetical protein